MKRFTIEYTRDDDGEGGNMRSTNDGFSALEILGVLAWKIHDIERQMIGEVRPDVVERDLIK